MSEDAPTEEQHERNAQAFVKSIEDSLAYALQHAPGNIFAQRDALVMKLRELLSEAFYRGQAATRASLKKQIEELLR